MRTILLIVLCWCWAGAQTAPSLPAGFSASGQGALIGGAAGRDPFSPLALSDDTTRSCFQFAYVNYCAEFQSGADGDIRRILGGFRIRRSCMTGSFGVSLFDAFSLWREGVVRLAIGTHCKGWAGAAGCDATLLGIVGNSAMRDFASHGDLSLSYRGRRWLFGAAGRFPMTDDGVGGSSIAARSRASIIFALRESPIGAPGVRLDVADFEHPSFSLVVGESIALSRHLAVSASIRSSPATIGIGCVFSGSSVSSALFGLRVPHLGWTGGVAADYSLNHATGDAAIGVAPKR